MSVELSVGEATGACGPGECHFGRRQSWADRGGGDTSMRVRMASGRRAVWVALGLVIVTKLLISLDLVTPHYHLPLVLAARSRCEGRAATQPLLPLPISLSLSLSVLLFALGHFLESSPKPRSHSCKASQGSALGSCLATVTPPKWPEAEQWEVGT